MSAQPLDVRMAHLEGAYEQISERLRGVEGRLTALDQKIDSRFDAFDKKLTTMMVSSLGTSAALIAALVGVVVSHH